MHHLHERATHTRIGLFFCPLVPPLPKEFPKSIENGYAAVAIAVGDVDVSIDGIHRYVGRHVYLSGKGTSIVRYKVQLRRGVSPQNIRVQATLYYQSMPPYFLGNRFETKGPDSQRLFYLASHLNLDNMALQNWKLTIASAESPGN